MPRYGMLIIIDRCNGCYNCYLACRDEFESNDYLPYSAAQPAEGRSWIRVTEKERGLTPKVKVDYVATPCLQCADAPCVDKSVDGAVYRRPDGIVLIDPEKAKGRREILSDCPHRLIQWNEEKDIPQKCTFCAHLLDMGWKEPRCVEACPAGALVFGDLDDPESEISTLMAFSKTEDINPDYELKPRVLYMGLPKRFVSGEVVLSDRQHECAEGVTVTLIQGDSTRASKTDSFGDFEFTGLKEEEFTLKIEHPGYTAHVFKDRSKEDVCLGEILLEPSS